MSILQRESNQRHNSRWLCSLKRENGVKEGNKGLALLISVLSTLSCVLSTISLN